jgi:Transposase, Mutator family
LIGATPEGKKELIGFQVGVRESAQSWRELLIDIRRRGLQIAPELAVGDGALTTAAGLDSESGDHPLNNGIRGKRQRYPQGNDRLFRPDFFVGLDLGAEVQPSGCFVLRPERPCTCSSSPRWRDTSP